MIKSSNAQNVKLYVKWSWLSFIFTPFWLCYHTMYLYFALYFLFNIAELTVNYFFEIYNLDFYSVNIAPLICHILCGMYGKSLHQRWLIKKGITIVQNPFSADLELQNPNLPTKSYPTSWLACITLPVFAALISLFLNLTYSLALLSNAVQKTKVVSEDSFKNVGYTLFIGQNVWGDNDSKRSIKKVDLKTVLEALNSLRGDQYITLDNGGSRFMQNYICAVHNGIKYYGIEYRDSKPQLYEAEECWPLEETQILYEKFYNNDDTYKQFIKWKELDLKLKP